MKLHKRFEQYFTAIFKLGRTERTAKQALRAGHVLEARLADLTGRMADLSEKAAELEQMRFDRVDLERHVAAQRAAFDSGLAVLSRGFSDLTARLDRLMLRSGGAGEQAAPPVPQAQPSGEGLDAFKDQFYHRLENRYRGSREEIARRLRVYLPDVERAVSRGEGKPVLDLGCGRGEWLGLLEDEGVEALGIDTNPVQIAEARELGLKVEQGDAVTALSEADDASLSVISAHHLIEHLPFDTVAWIVREAQRVLAPGGLLLLETPNTRNILVGATTFHTDPTHIKPMPEQVMGILLETAGFDPVEIRHINAHERFDEFLGKPDMNNELAFLLFGPQDLSVLGIKPEAG